MKIKIIPTTLPYAAQSLGALFFIPEQSRAQIAVFTHGYTSHKGSLLTWASRLAEEGFPCAIFDLPGHYLGTFSEVASIKEFETLAPHLYSLCAERLKSFLPVNFHIEKYILGGHSLGALMSLLALGEDYWDDRETLNVCVGFGFPPVGITHIFQTPFYKSTLEIRGQLVSKGLSPELALAWINGAKEGLEVTGRRIHLISGEDDIVVGKDGSERLEQFLFKKGNQTTLEKPKKLSHHLPENAASYIKQFLKRELK